MQLSTCTLRLFVYLFLLFLAAGCAETQTSVPIEASGSATPDAEVLSEDTESSVCLEEECDDGNPCTQGSWNPSLCSCEFSPLKGVSCDDGNACTSGDTCDGEGRCEGTSETCNDGNACTDDTCDVDEGCIFTPLDDGSACSDGDACTVTDTCQNGECVGESVVCEEDDNPCTTLAGCDADSGECLQLALDGEVVCDDGNDCTEDDRCTAGECIPGELIFCDDDNPCTDDNCNPKGGCTFFPNDAFCDDGSLCTTNDSCAQAKCSGEVISCDDTNPCTSDGCSDDTGCTHTNLDLPCEDGNPCTIGDACLEGLCVNGPQKDCDDENFCTTEYCDLNTGNCVFETTEGGCDDGNACTEGESCANGSCTGGSPIACSDSNPCTESTCDPVNGCLHTPVEAGCDDGDSCTEGESCQAGTCTGGIPTVCSDENPCTADSCSPTDGCIFSTLAGPCEDGDSCTTGDTCVSGSCIPDGILNCDDGNACTEESCSESDGCQYTNTNGPCNDGNACTTGDTCSGGDCFSGPALSCDDGNPCTTDGCDPDEGCTNSFNTESCDDGSVCTVDDTCLLGVCEPGATLPCDDGIPCTIDSCDAQNGCVHEPNDTARAVSGPCSTGTCSPTEGCVVETLSNCCGNGAEEGAEECDDGNAVAGDGCSATCTLESGCPVGAFCPTEDTTLSGTNSFTSVFIPEGVTVTCVGEEPLELNVSGNVLIEGALRADGSTGTDSNLSATGGTPPKVCGGHAGGDGFRECVSGATTFCENTPSSLAICSAAIGSNETIVGHACYYLSTADGMPGFGPAGGSGGAIGRPAFTSAGIPGGGGGGGHVFTGGSGANGGSGECGIPDGGPNGINLSVGTEVLGGSGGGAGGQARNGTISCPSNGGQCTSGLQCGACGSGCTGWGAMEATGAEPFASRQMEVLQSRAKYRPGEAMELPAVGSSVAVVAAEPGEEFASRAPT